MHHVLAVPNGRQSMCTLLSFRLPGNHMHALKVLDGTAAQRRLHTMPGVVLDSSGLHAMQPGRFISYMTVNMSWSHASLAY